MWLPNDPLSLHLRLGSLCCGLGFVGYNIAGRVTRFLTRAGNRYYETEILTEGFDIEDPPVFVFINGKYFQQGPPGVYRATQRSSRQQVTLDALALPQMNEWSEMLEFIEPNQPPSLKLTWDGDEETVRYHVYHATNAAKSNSRRVAIYSLKNQIAVENNEENGETITVSGFDGVASRASHYTLSVVKDGDTITVRAYDENAGVYEDEREWEDVAIPFGTGLSVSIPDSYETEGTTTFDIKVTPQREFDMKRLSGEDHYFRVRSERDDGDVADSVWVDKSLSVPPGQVSGLTVTYVGTGEVQVAFTLPSDADVAGAKVYLTDPDDTNNEIPFSANPVASVTGTSSQAKTVNIDDLDEGIYTLMVRAYDTDGFDDMSAVLCQFLLTEDAVSSGALKKPVSLSAEVTGVGEVKLRARVAPNGGESQIFLYSNNGSGAVDYDNIWGILSTKTDGIYEGTFGYLPAGTHTFGARAAAAGTPEPNKTVQAQATVYEYKVSVPSNLQVEVFEGVTE